MNDYKLNVIDKCSISPSKISITQEITKSYKNSLGYWEFKKKAQSTCNGGTQKKENAKLLKKKWHEFNISKNSQRNLRQKIEYLFLYAKPRKIVTLNKKVIPSFKVVFLTLKLCSKQKHPTSEIITQCFQPFMDIIRKKCGMKNYVYRVEFQKNGNVHFHVVTDTYIDYYVAQKEWNRQLWKLGYIQSYAEKMSKLSYWQYAERYGKDYNGKSLPKEIVYKRYREGKKKKWKNPNSVDVKNAKNGDNIGLYISKYFSKNDKNGKKTCKKNELDNEENSFALRLCYWSRSLSQLKPESMPIDYYDVNLLRELAKDASVIICYYDYCTCIYYDINKLSEGLAKECLRRYFERERQEVGYICAN